MTLTFNNVLLIGSLLLFIAIIISKTTSKISVPSILFFVGLGFLAGSDVLGIYFNDAKLSQNIGITALILILFSGGVETRWESIKPVLWHGAALSTIGVFITTIAVGLFVKTIFGFTLMEGLLLGAVVSSTDASALFNVLKSKNIGLKRGLSHLLELESGSNDPMAYFLTISLTYLVLNPLTNPLSLVSGFFTEMIIGAVVGLILGWGMVKIMTRVKLTTEGLYYVLIFSMVFLTYSLSQALHGNGFLSVYIAAISLGRVDFIHKKNIIRFYDGLAWLFQIAMFILLGLLAFPKQFFSIMQEGLIISLFLMLFARPLGVFISLGFAKRFNLREKVFISWVGLRGAVPIIFATYPLLAGVSKANLIFNIVFFIVLTSVLIQGSSVERVAKWLQVFKPVGAKRKFAVEEIFEDNIANELTELVVPENSSSVGKTIQELNLPKNSLIAIIERRNQFIKPKLNTTIEKGDKLIFISKEENEFIDLIKKLNK